MITTIFDGSLAPGDSSDWVQVPASALSSVTDLAGLSLQVGNDGVHALANPTNGGPAWMSSLDGQSWKVTVPFGYMRVQNGQGSSVTTKVTMVSI